MNTLRDYLTSRERGYTFVKAGVVGGLALTATIAVYGLPGSGDKPSRSPYAACTGEQEIEVAPGNTLSGLIEAHVETPPADRLKSGGNLELLANAVSHGDENPNDHILYVYRDQKTNPPSLAKGDIATIPEECHLEQ